MWLRQIECSDDDGDGDSGGGFDDISVSFDFSRQKVERWKASPVAIRANSHGSAAPRDNIPRQQTPNQQPPGKRLSLL